MFRKRGALFSDAEYAGKIGGTLLMRFVRMQISMLHWRMETLMLKGATSYAMLCLAMLVAIHV